MHMHIIYYIHHKALNAVLWHCWLVIRKDIWPVKNLSDVVLVWLSVWSEMQIICTWSSWRHGHPTYLASAESRKILPFWCWLTQAALEKRPLSGCSTSKFITNVQISEHTMRNATLKADFKHVVFLSGESKFSLRCFVFVVQHVTLWVGHLLRHTYSQNTNNNSNQLLQYGI